MSESSSSRERERERPAPVPERVGPMDRAHVMDWDPLDLGHRRVSKRTVHLADLDVHVYGLEEIKHSTRPIGLIILSHGWANKAKQMEPMASGLVGEIARLARQSGKTQTRDVLVATLDQRNHGERRRIRDGKVFDDNPARLIQSVANISGGTQDHEYVVDLLPAFLFPDDSRLVEEFMVTGFSMGGHVVWRMLRQDPRVRIGVPICSIPSEDLGKHLVKRVEALEDKTTYLPAAVRAYFMTDSAPGTYRGKKILAIYGGLDALVPHTRGTEKFGRIKAEAERPEHVQQIVQPDRGHVVSPEMVQWAAEWFWRWGFSEQS